MCKIFSLLICFILVISFSCKPKRVESKKNEQNDTQSHTDTVITSKEYTLTDKNVKFLWREYQYDKELNDTFYSIMINKEYCRTITDPERAAIGYVATFIGNECEWDEDYSDKRDNMKCIILDALNLGYQCSDQHLSFLRMWFKDDPAVLNELKTANCPTTPDGATVQDTFDEINVTTKGNQIIVIFKASGFNMRESDSWNWTERDFFVLDENKIKLIKKDKSKVVHENFNN